MRSATALTLVLVVLGCSVEADETPSTAPAADPNRLTGTVVEALDVSSYTYLRLETHDGETWAAIPQADIEVGAEVVVVNPELMSGFMSKTLGRQFDTIYFGTLDGPAAHPAAPAAGSNPHGSMPGGAGHSSAVSAGPIEVAKAEGPDGLTVGELFAAKAGLDGKTVAVRGKVVKYHAGIMGRNWIHLQDGTGDTASGTHDLTVTTSATAAVGDIVLVKGTVALDRDFGAGYRYPVIVEDGAIQ